MLNLPRDNRLMHPIENGLLFGLIVLLLLVPDGIGVGFEVDRISGKSFSALSRCLVHRSHFATAISGVKLVNPILYPGKVIVHAVGVNGVIVVVDSNKAEIRKTVFFCKVFPYHALMPEGIALPSSVSSWKSLQY